MRKRFGFQLAAPLACAAVLMACGGSDRANDERRAQEAATNAPAEAPAEATVALSGCVEAAPGTNQYVLRNVRFEPRTTGDPQRDTTTAGPHGITEGAWVRLRAGDQDLQSYLGQRVTLTGAITDSGRNTIGTAGAAGEQTPSGDRSQAAGSEDHSARMKAEAGRIARESMADGTAAEIRVQSVEGAGGNCQEAR